MCREKKDFKRGGIAERESAGKKKDFKRGGKVEMRERGCVEMRRERVRVRVT